MKKTLWFLSALAVAGFAFTACDEEDLNNIIPGGEPEEVNPVDNDEYCDGTCGEGNNVDAPNCFTDDITSTDEEVTGCSACSKNCGLANSSVAGYPNCVQGAVELGGGWGCASDSKCSAEQGYKVGADGIAKCEALALKTCTATSGCGEDQHCNLDTGECEDNTDEDPVVYSVVRIEDLSGKCQNSKGESKLDSKGRCLLDDPGADIDAIVLKKEGKAPVYATDVVAYKRSDFSGEFKTLAEVKAAEKDMTEGYAAADPTKALNAPDSFNTYGNNFDGTCKYWVDPNAAEKVHPYVSLGGEGGYIEVEMGGTIEAGDTIDVLEVGECKMTNTSDGGDQTAVADRVKVKIAILDDESSWVELGESVPDKTNKGILSFKVSGANMKK